MRKQWFEHVSKTRERENRKRERRKNPCSHQEAMKIASVTWGKKKAKIAKENKRNAKLSSVEEKTEK